MLCPNCNEKLRSNEKFCHNCGEKIDNNQEKTNHLSLSFLSYLMKFKCEYCRSNLNRGATTCHKCGRTMSEKHLKSQNQNMKIALIVVVVLVSLAAVGSLFEESNKKIGNASNIWLYEITEKTNSYSTFVNYYDNESYSSTVMQNEIIDSGVLAISNNIVLDIEERERAAYISMSIDDAKFELERSIKASLHDKKSYERIEIMHNVNMDGEYVTVFVRFRAKNEYGNYLVSTVQADYYYEEELLQNLTYPNDFIIENYDQVQTVTEDEWSKL